MDYNAAVGVLKIRNLDEGVNARLRRRAARHGRSMEDEVRQILRAAVEERPGSSPGFAASIHEAFVALHGADLDIPPREPPREPPRLEE